MYKSIIRPWLFRIDAEKIHNEIITLLHVYRHLPPVKSFIRSVYRPKATPFQWQNLTFGNRVGLSAGFDKEASCFDELSDLGFGFLEVGTVTPEKVAGNPSPASSVCLRIMPWFHVPDSTIPERQSSCRT